jgi:hypothetical protein
MSPETPLATSGTQEHSRRGGWLLLFVFILAVILSAAFCIGVLIALAT